MKELRNWCIDNNYKPGRAYYLDKILKINLKENKNYV